MESELINHNIEIRSNSKLIEPDRMKLITEVISFLEFNKTKILLFV